MKKAAIAMAIVILVCSLPLKTYAEEHKYIYIDVVDNEDVVKNYKVIELENNIMFSGEDLAEISGFKYTLEDNQVVFRRGTKELKINLIKNSYTIGDYYGTYVFENEIIQIDDKIYYSGAEVLPWLNVNCTVSEGKLHIDKDIVSFWEIDSIFFEQSEELLFDFEQCCEELDVNSKWLKVASVVRDAGLADILPVPFTSHTLGAEMDYIAILENMMQDKARVENSLDQIIDNAGDIEALLSVLDEYEDEKLPDDIEALDAINSAVSGLNNASEIVLYYKLLNADCKESLLWVNNLTLNRGAYDYPSELVSAALSVDSMYKGDLDGISEKVIYTLTDDVLNSLEDKILKVGYVDAILDILDFVDVFQPEWREGMGQISDYNTLAQCGIEVYQMNSKGAHIFNLETKRSHAMFFLYSVEQNWRTMADYAKYKDRDGLYIKYLTKADTALTLQGSFLACAKSTVNDSIEYDEGKNKEGYESKLREMFSHITENEPGSEVTEQRETINEEELAAYFLQHQDLIHTWMVKIALNGDFSFGSNNIQNNTFADMHTLLAVLFQADGGEFEYTSDGSSKPIVLSRSYVEVLLEKYTCAEGYNFDAIFDIVQRDANEYLYYDASYKGFVLTNFIDGKEGWDSTFRYELTNEETVIIYEDWVPEPYHAYDPQPYTDIYEFTLEEIPRLVSFSTTRTEFSYY